MIINILADFYWETKIDKVLDFLSNTGYRRFFEDKNYGSSLGGIVVGLMCHEPSLNLKQRIRLSKKEKIIYVDIMLDYTLFMKIDQNKRNEIVISKIKNEIPPIISKYKFEDFDLLRFENDLNNIFVFQ